MPKRRNTSKKKTSAPRSDAKRRALTLLGVRGRRGLTKSTLEARTRKELLDACRLLSLGGVSRATKAALVERLFTELGGEESRPRKTRAKPAPAAPAPRVSRRTRARDAAVSSVPSEPTPSPRSAPGGDEDSGESRPLAELSATEAPPKGFVPWGYGRTRVGALPVNPERLYVYWEVTDESYDEGRRALGTTASDARPVLRIYDTTDRLFDGTNAHEWFDRKIDGESRQLFVEVGKPGSEVFVELGLLSPEGRYAKIARSSRVFFPRREPVPKTREPEWLTVREVRQAPEAANVASARGTEANREARPRPFPRSLAPIAVAPSEPFRIPAPVARHEPSHGKEPVVGIVDEERPGATSWVTTTDWETSDPARRASTEVTETFEVDGQLHVVFGPWQVIVSESTRSGERRVVSRWEVFRSYATAGGQEVLLSGFGMGMSGSSARLGGSERRLRGASELRFRGASELSFGGASERRLRGASEWTPRAAGASERRFPGASERRFGGASERRARGASERRFPSFRSQREE